MGIFDFGPTIRGLEIFGLGGLDEGEVVGLFELVLEPLGVDRVVEPGNIGPGHNPPQKGLTSLMNHL